MQTFQDRHLTLHPSFAGVETYKGSIPFAGKRYTFHEIRYMIHILPVNLLINSGLRFNE